MIEGISAITLGTHEMGRWPSVMIPYSFSNWSAASPNVFSAHLVQSTR